MSSEEWSRRPKRGRESGGGEEKAQGGGDQAPAPAPTGGAQGGGAADGYRGGAYSDYPTMFPPPPGEGQPYMHPMHPYPPAAGGPPPQWPHAPFPPPMSYGMYPPPYQPAGYPPPPYPGAQGMPPPYYDHPQGPPRYPPEGGASPSSAPPAYERQAPAPAPRTSGEAAGSAGYGGDQLPDESDQLPEAYDEEEEKNRGPDVSSASRARLYIKSKVPTRQEILDRRARKNAQSRARAQKLRERVEIIQNKPESERTEEEKELYESYQYRRQRKNDRSRERAIEKKNEIERILSKPENKRTKIENDFLEIALSAKQRKNQGDRLRRQRIKQMKRAQARQEAIEYGGAHSHRAAMGLSAGMSEIPMSPLPGAAHHPSMSSPGMASPGMGISFPSPTKQGSTTARTGGVPLPFVPPNQAYGTGDSPAARSQLHMPQPSSNVEQKRHADGSMSISIGVSRPAAGEGAESGGTGSGADAGVSEELLMSYENNEEQQEGGNGDK